MNGFQFRFNHNQFFVTASGRAADVGMMGMPMGQKLGRKARCGA